MRKQLCMECVGVVVVAAAVVVVVDVIVVCLFCGQCVGKPICITITLKVYTTITANALDQANRNTIAGASAS